MKVWHTIELEFAKVAEVAVTPQLWNAGTTGVEVSAENPEFTTMRAYFNEAPDLEALRADIIKALGFIELPAAALKRMEALTVADQDWLAEWKKGYDTMEIGTRFLIVPSWKRAELAATERLIIQIDPGMAFGTGTHETTRGCLELLEQYWPAAQPPTLLDVGTGTGILAIAALKLRPEASVVGFDIDPDAIQVAEENAEINGVQDDLTFEVNRLAAYDGDQYAVVLANLTADVVIPLAEQLASITQANGGTLIVSGILLEQANDVTNELTQYGLTLATSKPDGEWISFAFQKQ